MVRYVAHLVRSWKRAGREDQLPVKFTDPDLIARALVCEYFEEDGDDYNADSSIVIIDTSSVSSSTLDGINGKWYIVRTTFGYEESEYDNLIYLVGPFPLDRSFDLDNIHVLYNEWTEDDVPAKEYVQLMVNKAEKTGSLPFHVVE